MQVSPIHLSTPAVYAPEPIMYFVCACIYVWVLSFDLTKHTRPCNTIFPAIRVIDVFVAVSQTRQCAVLATCQGKPIRGRPL